MSQETIMHILSSYWWIPAIMFALYNYEWITPMFGIVIVPDSNVAIVSKKFVIFGMNRTLADGEIVSLRGEAGIQADTLAPGMHFFYWPWQYTIVRKPFVTIPHGCVGVVEAKAGKPLSGGRVLSKRVECNSFQDARAFLTNGGERGPQNTIIPPGSYRIHSEVFTVTLAPVLQVPDNMVGVVTVKDGKPLPTGEIAGPETQGHNMFQDAQTFIDQGGHRGLQEQVMLSGVYYVHPQFASVTMHEMTTVDIAHVGVVTSFVGKAGQDVTGDNFKHANMVVRGEKGVCIEPLDPGRYPINPLTHVVVSVPTANIVLNWATGRNEAHKLDEKLSTIKVRSADGFDFNLDVSQIIHIPRADAPKVIARFGSVSNLVSQVLEPTIGNYFRNAAQNSGVLDFVNKRAERQDDARKRISEALKEYNVVAVDTLIGDINPPAALMKTLTDRKIAEQETVTYQTQKLAEDMRKDLAQAKALADTQPTVVDAERKVAIAEYDAKSAINKAEGEAKAKRINAEADAEVLAVVGAAQASKALAVGNAEAEVIQKKTDAVGKNNYAMIESVRALAEAKTALVPQIVAGGNGSDGGSIINVLLGTMLKDAMDKNQKS